MITALTAGCMQSTGPAAKANNRSTKEEIQAAGTQSDTTTTSTEDEVLGVPPDFSLSYYEHTKALIDAHCVSCHGDPVSGGAPSDFTLAVYETVGGKLGVYAKRDRIAARVEAGTMPPSGTMPDADRTKLLSWISAGANRGADPTADDPTASFVSPKAAAENPTGGSYKIEVAFTKVSDDFYYNLYYNTTGATSGGTLIMSDIPTTDVTTPWTTSTLTTGGDYYVYLDLFDGDGTKILAAVSEGTIRVDTSTATNHQPTVQITGVFNGSTQATGAVLKNASVPVTFTVADADNDPMTVTLEYQQTNGGAFEAIHTKRSSTLPFNWDTSGLTEGITYKIQVTVSDGQLEVTATSEAVFGVADMEYEFGTGTFGTLIDGACGNCHGFPTTQIFDSDDTASAQYWANPNHDPDPDPDPMGVTHTHTAGDDIVSRVMSGSMPQGQPLTAGEKAKVQLWYWQGAQ